MQTGIISFCEKQAYNIKSEDVKKSILETIETCTEGHIKIIQKHFDNLAQHHFTKLNKSPHLVSLRSNGNPYLLILTKYNFSNIAVFIDKKVKPSYYLPRMIITNLRFTNHMFNDTLFDGEMVKTASGDWTFIINDIYAHKHQSLAGMNILKRLEIIDDILSNDFQQQNIKELQICNMTIKRYFLYSQLKYMIEEFAPMLDYTCRGIYFTPLYYKFKQVLYNFDDNLIQKVIKIKYQNTEDSQFLTSSRDVESSILRESCNQESQQNSQDTSLENPNCNTNYTFLTEITELPDVYYLYDCADTHKHIGVAYVPTLKISEYLRSQFDINEALNIKKKINYEKIIIDDKIKWKPII